MGGGGGGGEWKYVGGKCKQFSALPVPACISKNGCASIYFFPAP